MPSTDSQLYRLKHSEIAVIRARLAAKQGGRCAVCKLPLSKDVLDHDHTTGAVRATLHSGCNALLGKVENNYKRYGVSNLQAFLAGAGEYLASHSVNLTGYLHPLHKTPEEKHERTKARARAAYARKRAASSG